MKKKTATLKLKINQLNICAIKFLAKHILIDLIYFFINESPWHKHPIVINVK